MMCSMVELRISTELYHGSYGLRRRHDVSSSTVGEQSASFDVHVKALRPRGGLKDDELCKYDVEKRYRHWWTSKLGARCVHSGENRQLCHKFVTAA